MVECPGVDGGYEIMGDEIIGDVWVFADLLRRRSISSRTIEISNSAGSSIPALLTIRLRSCSAIRSQPKNCLTSISQISSTLTFLNARSGTAVSKGNSSNPSTSRAFRSGANLRQGIFVNAEYKYFRSASSAALAFSFRLAMEPPKPKFDQRLDMPDMTLLTLETECMDKLSEDRFLRADEFLRNDT